MHSVMIVHLYVAFEVGCLCFNLIQPVLIVFLVNLSRIYETAIYESEYDHLLSLCKFSSCLQNVYSFVL